MVTTGLLLQMFAYKPFYVLLPFTIIQPWPDDKTSKFIKDRKRRISKYFGDLEEILGVESRKKEANP